MPEPLLQRTIDDTMHESLRAARAASPTAVDADTGAIVVLRYEDVERLAHDPRVIGVGLSFFDLMGIANGELRDWYGSLMFTNEGDHHHRLRRLVARAFTPRAVERHRTHARQLADTRLRTLADAGGGDLVDALADVPMTVICRLLGVPDDHVARFLEYGDALSPVFGLMDAVQIDAATTALAGLTDDVERTVAARADQRGDDLISDLLDAEEEGDKLTHRELVTMVGNLIVGGHDTTASQIDCALLTLLRNPDTCRLIRDHELTAADAASEALRFEPSIPFIPRTLAAPTGIGGTERPAGSMLFLSTTSANRDDRVWKHPHDFDPTRFSEPGAPRLLSFGSGAHYCLGAALARMTLEEVISSFVEHSPSLPPAHDLGDITWREVLGRSPAALPVTAHNVSP